MKQILIELHDVVLRSECKRWLAKHQEKIHLFLARNNKEAINIMQFCPIDLFLVELDSNPLQSDALESLAALSFYQPALPIVISVPPIFKKRCHKLKALSSLFFIDTPNNLKEFIDLVHLLESSPIEKAIAEIALSDFFILIELQKKTCLLAIETEDKTKKAIVYFNEGILYDAAYADIKAERAFVEILHWENAKIIFKNMNSIDTTKFRKQIQMKLSNLIIKARHDNIEISQEHLVLNSPIIEQTEPLITINKAKTGLFDSYKAEIARDIIDVQKTNESKTVFESENTVIELTEDDAKIKELKAKEIAKKFNALQLTKHLEKLQRMDNYLALGIFDIFGNVFITHHQGFYDIAIIAKNLAELIKTTLNAISAIGLGESNFMQINYQNTILEAIYLKDFFIIVILLNPNAKNTGLVKMYLNKLYDMISQQLSE